MVRNLSKHHREKAGFPHARGDGPMVELSDDLVEMFSPRPWGWSALMMTREEMRSVFPTPVGMVRAVRWLYLIKSSFPHARGDGPQSGTKKVVDVMFSPRPWGWSVAFNIT